MKKITLESVELKNFKSTQHRKVEFSDNTDICSPNRGGKTTIFDAVLWLMSDIDSAMNAGIGEVKTYDENNNIIHNLENSVIGIFNIDGQKLELSKTVKEVWSNETTFKNTVVYEIDKVAIAKKDYQERLDGICNASIMQFSILPLSFFDKKFGTDQRRSFITGLAEIPEIKKSEWLTNQLVNTDIDNLKKSLNKSIKESQKLIENNQARIDELTKQIKDVDIISTRKEISKFEKEIIELQENLSSISKLESGGNSHYDNAVKQISELQQKKANLQSEYNKTLSDFEHKKQSQISKIELQISKHTSDIELKKSKIESIEKSIEQKKARRNEIKNEVAILNTLAFDENATICPTCNRTFEISDIEKIKEKFNTNKVVDFNKLLSGTKKLKEEIAIHETDTGTIIDLMTINNESIEKLNAKKAKISDIVFHQMNENHIEFLYQDTEITEINKFFKNNNLTESGQLDYIAIETAIAKLKEIKPYESGQNEEKRESITGLIASKNASLQPLRAIKSQYDTNVNTNKRLAELREEIKQIGANIQDLTDKKHDIDGYVKAQMTATQDEVNKLFGFIKVSMFETLQNGNIKDVCEITAGGVPFTVLNTESKTNALIDIQNAISKRYGVQLPIFVDNRESTYKIIDTQLQVVNLYHIPDSEFTVK